MGEKIHCLVGKTITAIHLADDKGALRFDLEGAESIVARADGDCCSHTWIEHVELPALGFPAKVISAEELNLNKPGIDSEEGGQEYLQYYGFKINTDRGEIVIDYRNSSNGYYGGSLEWPGEYFYGEVFAQNVSKEKWSQLT